MKVGIILTGRNMQEYVVPCLSAWIVARAQKLGGHDYLICAVSVPFAGFPDDHEDDTVPLLRGELEAGRIDHLITEPKNIPETVARGMALTWLRDAGCNISIQVDLDEEYTLDQIDRIFRFVQYNPFAVALRASLKNYIFDGQTYLIEPFTPMRIHRLRPRANLEAVGFWADNNVMYIERGRGDDGLETGRTIRDSDLATMTIPPSVAWIRHMTWLSDDRSRRKVAYHENHFNSRPSGVRSSYRWDDAKGLVFNEAYYQYVGQPMPQVARDE